MEGTALVYDYHTKGILGLGQSSKETYIKRGCVVMTRNS